MFVSSNKNVFVYFKTLVCLTDNNYEYKYLYDCFQWHSVYKVFYNLKINFLPFTSMYQDIQ